MKFSYIAILDGFRHLGSKSGGQALAGSTADFGAPPSRSSWPVHFVKRQVATSLPLTVREQQTHARRRARDDARRAAEFLKTNVGADRVVLFGSVARAERLSPHSDLDLAVAGLSWMEFYRAVACVQSVSDERFVNLVRLESCRHSLRQRIKESGIER